MPVFLVPLVDHDDPGRCQKGATLGGVIWFLTERDRTVTHTLTAKFQRSQPIDIWARFRLVQLVCGSLDPV